MLINSVMLGET